MKSLEAFSLGKRFGQPELNEDSLVIMPDVGYAVIDGVTDRNGTRYDGMLAGRFASRAAGKAFTKFLLALGDDPAVYRGPQALVALLTDAVAAGYRAKGVYEQARTDLTIRAGCAVTLAFVVGDRLEIVAVGDSGVRINGGKPAQDLKPLDDVTSRLRREAWRYFEEAGVPYPERDRLAALITWKGVRNQPAGEPTARPEVAAEIERRAFEVNRAALPDAPDAELLELIHNGIEFGQAKFQNVDDRALSYGVIDGFDVPPRHVVALSMPLAGVETIEMYSDGYFSVPSGFGVAAWEEEYRRVEQEDPHKIGRYMSTKGSTDISLTDDRTYLGIRLT